MALVNVLAFCAVTVDIGVTIWASTAHERARRIVTCDVFAAVVGLVTAFVDVLTYGAVCVDVDVTNRTCGTREAAVEVRAGRQHVTWIRCAFINILADASVAVDVVVTTGAGAATKSTDDICAFDEGIAAIEVERALVDI